MGRRPRAWLVHGTGKRVVNGRALPSYYVEWRDRGKHRMKAFGSQKAARAFCLGLNRRIDRGRSNGLIPVDLDGAIEEFGAAVGLLSASTQADMASVLDRFGEFAGLETTIGAIRGADIDRYLESRRLAGSPESTLAKHYRYLRRFFRWALNQHYVGFDPTSAVTVKPVSVPREKPPLPTDKQIADLMEAIQDERLKLAVALALTSGLDRGVIAALVPDQFDVKQWVLTIRRPKTRRSSGATVIVPIHPDVRARLSSVVSATPVGTPLFPAYRHRGWWKEARKAAGPPWSDMRIADLRPIASGLLQRRLPLGQVRQLLGHSSISTTARHYTPADPAILQALSEWHLPWFPASGPKKRRKRGAASR